MIMVNAYAIRWPALIFLALWLALAVLLLLPS
jgi:hypothetical protein